MVYRATARTEARRAHNRRRILDATKRRVLEGGFASLSVAAVAADAGVATGSVYRHFSGKTELCTELFRAASQGEVGHVREVAQGSGSAAGRLRDTVRVFIGRAARGRRLAWALIAEPLDPALERERLIYRRAYAAVFERLVRDGVVSGEFEPQDTCTAASALVGAMAETLIGPLAPDQPPLPKDRLERLIREVSRFCLRAVGCRRNST